MTPLEQLLDLTGSTESGEINTGQPQLDAGSLSIANIFKALAKKYASLSSSDQTFATRAAERIKGGETLSPKEMQRLLELAGV